jgi:hypothetical protein
MQFAFNSNGAFIAAMQKSSLKCYKKWKILVERFLRLKLKGVATLDS